MTAGDFANCGTVGAHRAPLQLSSFCLETTIRERFRL